jgi:hypothetical protein
MAAQLRSKTKGGSSFKKKTQKTFSPGVRLSHGVRDSIVKVFCFFFSKKKRLP